MAVAAVAVVAGGVGTVVVAEVADRPGWTISRLSRDELVRVGLGDAGGLWF
jgi:hypothetical protein